MRPRQWIIVLCTAALLAAWCRGAWGRTGPCHAANDGFCSTSAASTSKPANKKYSHADDFLIRERYSTTKLFPPGRAASHRRAVTRNSLGELHQLPRRICGACSTRARTMRWLSERRALGNRRARSTRKAAERREYCISAWSPPWEARNEEHNGAYSVYSRSWRSSPLREAQDKKRGKQLRTSAA